MNTRKSDELSGTGKSSNDHAGSRMVLQFKDLKKRLWIGTILLDIMMISVVAVYWPHYLKPLLWGCGMGFFYLWSLMFSAEHPRHKIQSVFSLIRIVFLAYPIVSIAGRDIHALALVMCGLLSYKGLLAVETVIQALPTLKHLSKKKTAVPGKQGTPPEIHTEGLV